MHSKPRKAGLPPCSRTHATTHKRAGRTQGTTHRTMRHIPHTEQITPQRHAYKMAGHTHVFLETLSPVNCLKMARGHSSKALWVVAGSRTGSKHVPLMFRLGPTPPSAAPLVLCPATATQRIRARQTETGREIGIVTGTDPSRLLLPLLHRSLSPCTRLWRSRC